MSTPAVTPNIAPNPLGNGAPNPLGGSSAPQTIPPISASAPPAMQSQVQTPPQQQPPNPHAVLGRFVKHIHDSLEGTQTQYVSQPDGTVQEVQAPRKPGGFFRDIIGGVMAGMAAGATPTAHPSGAAGLGLGFQAARQQAQGQDSQARNRAIQNAALQKNAADDAQQKQTVDQNAAAQIAKSTITSLDLGHNIGLHNDDHLDQYNKAVDVVAKQALANGGALAPVDGNGQPGNGPALMAAFQKDPTMMQGPEGFHRIPSISYDTSGLEHKDGKWVDPKTGQPPDWNQRATVSLIDLPNSAWGKQISISKGDANAVAGRQIASGKDADQVQTSFGGLFGLGLKNLDQMNNDRRELYRPPKNENEAKGMQAQVQDIRDRMKSDPDSVTAQEKAFEAVKGPMMDAYKFKTQAPTAAAIKAETENLNKKLAAYAADPANAPKLTPDERATLVQRQKSDPAATKGVPADIIAAIGARPVPAQFDLGEDDPAYKQQLQAWGKASTDKKAALQASSGLARYQMLGNIRDYNVTNTGDQPIDLGNGQTIQPGEMGRVTANQVAKLPPQVILNTQDGTKIMGKQAAIRDIQTNVDNLRDKIGGLDNMDAATRAKLILALRDPNPESALQDFRTSEVKSLSDPKVADAIIAMQSMAENVMLARSVQGIGGGGSDLMRRALMNLVPNATTPSKEYADKQLDTFQRTLNQLKTGIPTTGGRQTALVGAGRGVNLQTPTAATPAPQTHVFSLSAWQKANPNGDVNAAKAAAQNAGYTVQQ